MYFNKGHIIQLLKRISEFASDNLQEIEKLNIDLNNEHDSFYVGMITRQFAISNDLSILFTNKSNKFLTSELILFRCITDDYIHLIYLINQEDSESEVINFNADAVSKNFNKIKELADFNERKLGGNYPFYPTSKLLEEVKDKIKNSPRRQQYFLDIGNFKFKTFKSTGNLIRDLVDSNYSHKLRRAYFIWRKLSDFVHYSNFTYEEEMSANFEIDTTYREFAEIISYSYFVLIGCFEHFKTKYNLTLIDSNNLANYYKEVEHK